MLIHDEWLSLQILYSYPPDKPTNHDVVSFCFPHGVQPTLLERTPSMSALNELVYSQQYAHDDAVSFVFLLKVGRLSARAASLYISLFTELCGRGCGIKTTSAGSP